MRNLRARAAALTVFGSIVTAAAALGSGACSSPPDGEGARGEASLDRAGGTCRGSCTLQTRTYTDMNGQRHEFETYRCVDFGYSAVRDDSHISSRADCNQVAKCIADGLCSADEGVAVAPQGTWNPRECRQDADGNWWCNAHFDRPKVAAYFLHPTGPRQTLQRESTYTATEPPRSANPGLALGGKQPCGIPKEHVTGSISCPTCTTEARTTFRSETERCYTDPQLDVPRQYLHAWGDYPQNALEGQTQVNFDAEGCFFSAAGVVGNIGGFFVTGTLWAGAWAFLRATASSAGLTRCIPVVTGPSRFDVFLPGAGFSNAPMGPEVSSKIQPGHAYSLDIEGQVCSRTLSYLWSNTRTITFRTLVNGIPYDGWEIAGTAESDVRFESGGGIVVEGTEPCRCRQNPDDESEIGLKCSAAPTCKRWSTTSAGDAGADASDAGADASDAGGTRTCLEWDVPPRTKDVVEPWVLTDRTKDLGACRSLTCTTPDPGVPPADAGAPDADAGAPDAAR